MLYLFKKPLRKGTRKPEFIIFWSSGYSWVALIRFVSYEPTKSLESLFSQPIWEAENDDSMEHTCSFKHWSQIQIKNTTDTKSSLYFLNSCLKPLKILQFDLVKAFDIEF